MKRLNLCLLALLASLCPLAEAQAEEEQKVTFRVTRFDLEDRPAPKFTVGTEEDRQTVEVPLTTIEGPITVGLRDGKYLDFFEGQGVSPTITVDVPVNMRKDLLLFFVTTKDKYKVLKVHAPKARIRGGDRYIVNATKNDIGIQLGEMKPVLLKASKAEVLKGPGGSLKMLPVVIKEKQEEKWVTISEENWSCDPRFRSFLFIYRSPRTGYIEFHGLRDFID